MFQEINLMQYFKNLWRRVRAITDDFFLNNQIPSVLATLRRPSNWISIKSRINYDDGQ